MRGVVVNEWMSLDGVVQSAGADDDTTEGFTHAGWHLPYFDEVSPRWVVDGYARAGGFLFGRRTTSCSWAAGRTPARRSRRSPGR